MALLTHLVCDGPLEGLEEGSAVKAKFGGVGRKDDNKKEKAKSDTSKAKKAGGKKGSGRGKEAVETSNAGPTAASGGKDKSDKDNT